MKGVGNCHLELHITLLNYYFIGYQREIEGTSWKFAAPYNIHNHTKLNNDKFIERDYEAQQRVSSTIYDSASFSVNSFQSSAGHDSISDSSFSSSLFSTEVLASPGRRGPLSSSARADAKAVKDIKACWRCKILRKKVAVPLRPSRKK